MTPEQNAVLKEIEIVKSELYLIKIYGEHVGYNENEFDEKQKRFDELRKRLCDLSIKLDSLLYNKIQ